jgi:hypothetical protein
MTQSSVAGTKTYCAYHSKYPHKGFVPSKLVPDKDCCICMTDSIQQYRKAIEISDGHIVGKYCKQWQQCTYCCRIKHWSAVVRHFSGSCSSKCPVCRWPQHVKDDYEKQLLKIVENLYVWLLKGPRYGRGFFS